MKNATEESLRPPPKVGWFGRWRVGRLLDMPEKEAAPRLVKYRAFALPVLLEAVDKGDPRAAKAAYLIGKLAESNVDCGEAVMPLFGLLQCGSDLERGNAAVALARIRTKEAISMLVAALNDKNNITRRYAAVGLGVAGDPLVEKALKKAAEGDSDPRVRELARNALKQIAELQQ